MATKKSARKREAPDDEREEEDESEDRNESEADDHGAQDEGPPSWLERAATIVSALLVAAMLGVLIYDSTRDAAPPAFETKIGTIDTIGGNLRVPVELRNTGDEAGHNVLLHIELRSADSVIAESDLTIDWLAGRSKHDAVGFFEKPALPFKAQAGVRGYSEP
jgi:uncharacterized protein (TIGR02588 family)